MDLDGRRGVMKDSLIVLSSPPHPHMGLAASSLQGCCRPRLALQEQEVTGRSLTLWLWGWLGFTFVFPESDGIRDHKDWAMGDCSSHLLRGELGQKVVGNREGLEAGRSAMPGPWGCREACRLWHSGMPAVTLSHLLALFSLRIPPL